ncbi:ribonuclease P protein component [Bacillota bacterium]
MLKINVLRNRRDFSALYNKGKSVRERSLILIYRKNGLSYCRRAFLASKKVGNSVKRNRARRLLRESYRTLEEDIIPGYDVIFIAKSNIVDLKCASVCASMESALKRANLLKRENNNFSRELN